MNWGARSDRPRWDDLEVEALSSAVARFGDEWGTIARIVGRTPYACRSKAQQMGFTPSRPQAEAYQRPISLPPPPTTTARLCGDPLPGRSALDQKRAAHG
jgi:hypothetical protein